MKDNDLAVKLSGVSKIYRLHQEKPTLIENIFKKSKREKFLALDDIDLEIKKGERVGIVGPNGSGKTTLLKIIAGITTLNKGKVETWGKLVSLIHMSAGFHPELTGQENIKLNALLVGMERWEIRERYQEIVDFAEIGKFIDAPFYTYSSGMKLRLGFSIAVATNPDILVLDEEIMFGDENFHQKSVKRIDEIARKGKTILVASHWMDYLRENCRRIIWIDGGKIRMDGGMNVLKKYQSQLTKVSH